MTMIKKWLIVEKDEPYVGAPILFDNDWLLLQAGDLLINHRTGDVRQVLFTPICNPVNMLKPVGNVTDRWKKGDAASIMILSPWEISEFC